MDGGIWDQVPRSLIDSERGREKEEQEVMVPEWERDLRVDFFPFIAVSIILCCHCVWGGSIFFLIWYLDFFFLRKLSGYNRTCWQACLHSINVQYVLDTGKSPNWPCSCFVVNTSAISYLKSNKSRGKKKKTLPQPPLICFLRLTPYAPLTTPEYPLPLKLTTIPFIEYLSASLSTT